MEEACKPDAVSSVASDNARSECNNDIVTETYESDDVSVKPSLPWDMWGFMQKLFTFGVEYIYLWCGLWLSLR